MTRIKYRLQSGKLRRGLVPRPIQFLLSLSLYRGFVFPRRPHCTGSIVVGLAQVRNWDAHVELREAPSSVGGCWLAGKRTNSNTQGEGIRWGSLAATYGATTTATGKMGQCRESGAVGMARLQSAMRRRFVGGGHGFCSGCSLLGMKMWLDGMREKPLQGSDFVQRSGQVVGWWRRIYNGVLLGH